MVRFLRDLEPSIAEKVVIQPYWSFEDVCKLAIKVEKYSKGKRVFKSSCSKHTVPPKPYVPSKNRIGSKGGRKQRQREDHCQRVLMYLAKLMHQTHAIAHGKRTLKGKKAHG